MTIRRLGLFRMLCRVSWEVVTERGSRSFDGEGWGRGGEDVEVAVEELDSWILPCS